MTRKAKQAMRPGQAAAMKHLVWELRLWQAAQLKIARATRSAKGGVKCS